MQDACTAPRDDENQVSDFDAKIFRAITAYAFDEAECCPAQARIARDAGCARESVNRSVRRLRAAGWLTVEKRRADGAKFDHCVYTLLGPYEVSDLAARRITRRAHNTPARRRERLGHRLDHTNKGVGGRGKSGWCGCRWCRPDRASVGRPSRAYLAPLPRRRARDEQIDRLRQTMTAAEVREIVGPRLI